VKDHLLDPYTQAALQALVAAAAALGIGALLTRRLFDHSGVRDRDVGFAVFETFSVIAILTACFVTAYFSIKYLQAGEEMSPEQFGQVGAPLVIAVVLLVLLTAIARFSELPGGAGGHIPTILVTVFFALVVGFLIPLQTSKPEYIALESSTILLVAGLVGFGFLRIERFWINDSMKAARKRLVRLTSEGYKPVESSLLPGLPTDESSAAVGRVICWSRKGRLFLDQAECRRVGTAVDERWERLAAGEAMPPLNNPMLTQLGFKFTIAPWPPRPRLMLIVTTARADGESEPTRIEAGPAGLFDVTELDLVDRNPAVEDGPGLHPSAPPTRP
jgi:hypothetical protein